MQLLMLVEIQLAANWHCRGLRKATGTPTKVKKGKKQLHGHMCTHKQLPSVESVCFHFGQIDLASEKKKGKAAPHLRICNCVQQS